MAFVLHISAVFECMDILEGIKPRKGAVTATFATNIRVPMQIHSDEQRATDFDPDFASGIDRFK